MDAAASDKEQLFQHVTSALARRVGDPSGEGRVIPGPEGLVVKVGAGEASGSIAVLEATVNPGFGPPLHIHHCLAILGSSHSLADLGNRGAAPSADRAGGRIQPVHGEPAHHPHRGEGIPHRAAEQPLGSIRRAVSGLRGDRPPVAPGIWLIRRRRACLPAATALSARSAAAADPAAQRVSGAPARPPILAAAAAFGPVVLTNA